MNKNFIFASFDYLYNYFNITELKDYFNKWKNVIIQSNSVPVLSSEFFEWDYNYLNIDSVHIRFNITKIFELLKHQEKIKTEKILLNKIRFTPTNLSSITEMNKNPILLVETFGEQPILYLAIDGNHRITYALVHNQKQIYAKILNIDFLTMECFSDEFSYYFYHFLYELNQLNKMQRNIFFKYLYKRKISKFLSKSTINTVPLG